MALLIDTENVSSQPIDKIVAEAEKLGMVTIRQLYGNWANDGLRHWQNVTNQYCFEAIHNFPVRQGKKTLTKLLKEHKNLFEIRDPLQDNHIEVMLHK